MFNLLFKNKSFFLLLLIIFLVPSRSFASNVYIETAKTSFFVGDRVVLNIRLDSDGHNINTVEGKVLLKYLPAVISVGDVSLANSQFSLWPRKPSLAVGGEEVSFVGGRPNGLVSKDAIIFKLVLNLQKAGQITLTPSDLAVYLNDGQGSKDLVKSKPFTIKISPAPANYKPVDEWSSFVSSDHTPPQPFEVLLGQDNSVFEGQKFLSFNASDNLSDIKYYEVKEGDLPVVRSGDTYILQQQNKSNRVTITAYDTMGNKTQSFYQPASRLAPGWGWVALALGILAGLVYFIIKKLKNNNSNKDEPVSK